MLTLEKLRSNLQNNVKSRIYSVYVPSLKKSFDFSHITVLQKKSLAKIGLESTDQKDFLFYKAILSLIDELSNRKLPIDQLTEIDRISIMAQICEHNILAPIKYKITCNSCNEQFVQALSFQKFVKIINEADPLKVEKLKYELNGDVYEFVLKFPTIASIMSYKQAITDEFDSIDNDPSLNAEQKKTEKDIAIENSSFYEFVVMFVDSVSFNGEVVQDYAECNIIDKIEFMHSLPYGFVYGDDNSIREKIVDIFYKEIDKVKYSFECPLCKRKIAEVMSFSTFFLT